MNTHPPIKGKWLPDQNATAFDYLHAIRAILSQAGMSGKGTLGGQLYELADEGMNLPAPRQECQFCGGSGLADGEPCEQCTVWCKESL